MPWQILVVASLVISVFLLGLFFASRIDRCPKCKKGQLSPIKPRELKDGRILSREICSHCGKITQRVRRDYDLSEFYIHSWRS